MSSRCANFLKIGQKKSPSTDSRSEPIDVATGQQTTVDSSRMFGEIAKSVMARVLTGRGIGGFCAWTGWGDVQGHWFGWGGDRTNFAYNIGIVKIIAEPSNPVNLVLYWEEILIKIFVRISWYFRYLKYMRHNNSCSLSFDPKTTTKPTRELRDAGYRPTVTEETRYPGTIVAAVPLHP